ncbi:hypothetical protein [Planococcus sp. 107-1]|uniref:hypothetical protein n=1 Tax=Planococcus sp. 107-1 TaxID=2908840 RepID=UPI001F304C17|nr:hypothetical protein [Planococcus sp. 107-1]UJF27559.1 hypothetical protein L0M13_03555 [Planococcus sp. 107-1]
MSFQEKTSADNKSIGFDYQYYYFLYLLLNLKQGESIGIEVKDDVHLDLRDGKQVLLQLKHSIQKNSAGEIKNLTELDGDVWKTISNWVNIVNDAEEGRTTLKKQLDYIKITNFILVSNKSSSETNNFLISIKKLKNGEITIESLLDDLEILFNKSKDIEIKGWIGELKKQNKKWINLFIQHLDFDLNQDDLISKIHGVIREKLVKENRIKNVFESLDSNIRMNNYITVKKKEKIIITFEEFRKSAEIYFEKARASKLPIRKKTTKFSKDYFNQTFIKQLIDIEVLEKEDIEELLRLTGYKMQAYTNLEAWEQEGEITTLQRKQFEDQCILQWKNAFNSTHTRIRKKWATDKESISEDDIIEYAQKCYFKVIDRILELEETRFDMEFSNGQFYLLSDTPMIGWKIDWKEKYS